MSVNRYIASVAGTLTMVVPATSSAGISSAGQIVALGTTGQIDSSMIPSGGGANEILVANEIVSGSGTSFTLARMPSSGTVRLYNGSARLWPSADYTISGASISATYSIVAGSMLADYIVTPSTSPTLVANEVVSGAGTSFTLANVPISGTVAIYSGSARLVPWNGSTGDFLATGANIVMQYSVASGGLLADYYY